jgi:hypothetical protein
VPLIDAVRGPLLGKADGWTLAAAAGEATALALLAFVLLAATRRRVPYWV